jgi:hypothetical protein
MATVPGSGPNVLPNSGGPTYQRADVNADMFGGAQGRALEQAGRGLQQLSDNAASVALQEQREANQKAIKDADVRFREGLIGLQYGDGTPENPGFQGLAGDEPARQMGSYLERAKKLQNDIATSLGNERQVEDFTLEANRLIVSAQGDMARHAAVETKKSRVATSEARLRVAANEAALSYNNPEVIDRSLATARGEAVSQAQLMGASPEVTKELIRKAETQVLTGAIQRANEKDPEMALGMLQQNMGRMDTQAALTLNTLVQKKYVEVKSQEVADEYTGYIRSGKMTLEQARDAMRQSLSGDQEEGALKEFNARIGEMYRDESNLRARRAEERTLANERRAEELRDAAEVRRAEKDRIAEEQRLAREARQKAADLRRDKRDLERADALERQATALDQSAKDREARLLRQQAADTRRAKAEEIASQTNDVAQTITDQGGTLEERVAKTRENFTGELRTRVERLVQEMYLRDKRIAEETRATRLSTLQDAIAGGQRFDDLPVTERSFLTGPEEKRLREIDRRTQLGIPNVSTEGYLGKVQEMYDAARVDEFLAIPLDEARTNLSDEDYKQFTQMRRQMSRGQLDPTVSADRSFVLDRIGSYKEFQGNTPEKKAVRDRLTEVLMAELNARRAENRGQRLSAAEREEIAQAAIKEYVTTKPGLVSDLTFGYLGGNTTAENKDVTQAALSQGPRIAVQRAASSLNIPLPSDQKEREAYIASIYAVELTDQIRAQGRAEWFRVFGRGAQSPTDIQLKALYWKATRNR